MIKDLERFRITINNAANNTVDNLEARAYQSRWHAYEPQSPVVLRAVLVMAASTYDTARGVVQVVSNISGGKRN